MQIIIAVQIPTDSIHADRNRARCAEDQPENGHTGTPEIKGIPPPA